jgi:hypothetical protein
MNSPPPPLPPEAICTATERRCACKRASIHYNNNPPHPRGLLAESAFATAPDTAPENSRSHRVQNPWEHSQEANPLAARAFGQALSQPPAQAHNGQHDGRRRRSAGGRHGAWLEHGRRGRASCCHRCGELVQAVVAPSRARALRAGLRARLLPVLLLASAPLRAGTALGTA